MRKCFKLLTALLLSVTITACQKEVIPEEIPDDTPAVPQEDQFHLKIEAVDEGQIVFYSYEDYYRYGPSIMEYEDGSMDVWFSSPGNNGSQWDWITYRHSDDGENWGYEQVVLRPTPGSWDQCSVCDPAVIYFNGYYYLAYTGTYDYDAEGMNNSLFVARSEYPDGPFEKWNGIGWGGDPEPIIAFEGDPSDWGIGEPSFVIYGEDLYIYYSSIDAKGHYISLSKADLVDDWPNTIRFKSRTLAREHIDSLDVVYDEDTDMFLGFTVYMRMADVSRIVVYGSGNGKNFEKLDTTKDYIEDYAHNMGIAKSPEGHIHSDREVLIGYAYGEDWGRWNTRFQKIRFEK